MGEAIVEIDDVLVHGCSSLFLARIITRMLPVYSLAARSEFANLAAALAGLRAQKRDARALRFIFPCWQNRPSMAAMAA